MDLGRNFDWREAPIPAHRLGRFKTGTTAIPNGVGIVRDGDPDPLDKRTKVKLAVGGDDPFVGAAGIANYEAFAGTYWRGLDPTTARASDIDKAPANSQLQMCFGTECILLLQNTVDRSFQGQRDYDGRKMITDDLDTLVIGDLLRPAAAPADAGGYWTKNTTKPWLRITYIDVDRDFVEAQMLF
jgi:hypothetical protein